MTENENRSLSYFQMFDTRLQILCHWSNFDLRVMNPAIQFIDFWIMVPGIIVVRYNFYRYLP